MGRILELQNGDNFSLQYTNSIPATSIEMVNGKDIYAKLTEVIIPVVFNKPIILVNISTSVPVGKIWRYAGRIRQIFPTVFGDSFLDDKPLFLGKRNLILFSDVLSNYTLNYLPPSWFVDVSITIYQYDGTDKTTLENDMQTIKEAIGV
ncbi:hypothetical protein NIES4075_25010 [Tolypothrix sp. NIES-4075]|uniref:hypothetical protein n=1 Tax=Tolypothrix sp. NIES-4075 TaxID=2005459 RepID=UPI000B5C88EF|nr:hypothetical protein [Tolypothrix sp. NIES-4075]GAX41528.1 hypothetical protein NIES4075_25010 [Tolypothrix sp. NIES-4075]